MNVETTGPQYTNPICITTKRDSSYPPTYMIRVGIDAAVEYIDQRTTLRAHNGGWLASLGGANEIRESKCLWPGISQINQLIRRCSIAPQFAG